MKQRKSEKKAVLALESGEIYLGYSFGAIGERLGEIVFNTSMTGYQEILTDPSYKGQIIVMTEPHIGNIGVNVEDVESAEIAAEGFVVREISAIHSNWRSRKSLQNFLIESRIPAISGIDTRALTKHIRDVGAMRSIISTVDFDPNSLMKKIKKSPSMIGRDLAKEVTCKKTYLWALPEWQWSESRTISQIPNPKSQILKSYDSQLITCHPELVEGHNSQLKVVVMDFGTKHNILRCLAERNCNVTVVPAQTSADEILSMKPDGIIISNGPGDPAPITYAIKTIRKLIHLPLTTYHLPLPIFGICLGQQLLGLALGGKTFKLKFGHHGANHPVKDLKTGKIEITTQNHGFCVDIESLKDKNVEITHINLNDNTLEGMRHKTLPIFSVQYHPESSAGPHDSRYLFDRFVEQMKETRNKKSEIS